MNLKDKLIKIRKDNNLTQEELADKLYITRQTVSNWENDKFYPDIETLILISDMFNISLDNLLKTDTKVIKDMDKKIKQHRKLRIIVFLLIIILASSLYIGYKYHQNHQKVITKVVVKKVPEGYMVIAVSDQKIGRNQNDNLSALVDKYVDIYIDNEEYYNKTAIPIVKKAKVFDYGHRSIVFVVNEEDYLELQKYNIDDDIYYMLELSN